MALYVRVNVGHWPHAYDEPSTRVFASLTWLNIAAMWYTIISFGLLLVTTSVLIADRRLSTAARGVVTYLIPFIAFLVVLHVDTPFSKWLLD